MVKTKFYLGLDVTERDLLVAQGYPLALVGRDLVIVAPLVNAHLLADDLNRRQRPYLDRLAAAHLVNRERGFVAMGNGPDDVLRSERGIAAEENLWMRRSHRFGIHLGHIPLVEFDADVALDPWESVFLTDRDQDIIAGKMLIGFAGRN